MFLVTVASDPDFQPIVFTEDYRRAKRNSLWWSGITLLAAIGTTSSSEDGVAVELFQTGLTYHQWQLVLVAFVASVFTLVAYFRAERVAKRQNSELFLGRKLGEISQVLDDLSQELQRCVVSLDGAKHRLETFDTALNAEFGAIGNEIADQTMQAEERRKVIGRGTDTQNFKELDEGLRSILHDLAELGSSWQRRAVESRAEMAQKLDSADNIINTRLNQLSELSARLTGWHHDIQSADKRFFLWHDQVPVYGLFVLALIFSLYAVTT